MASKLTEAVISFCDLVEAEGRELRRGVASALKSASLFFFGLLFLTASALALCTALFIFLSKYIGCAASALVTACPLALAGLFMLKASAAKDSPDVTGCDSVEVQNEQG